MCSLVPFWNQKHTAPIVAAAPRACAMDVRALRDALAAGRYAPPSVSQAQDCASSPVVASSARCSAAAEAEARYNPLTRRAAAATCAPPEPSSSDEEEEASEDRSVCFATRHDVRTPLCALTRRFDAHQAAALRAYYSRRRYAVQARRCALRCARARERGL